MRHRSEIDGLRAVAVVPVILYHAGFGAFGGGYVGVDVFFVISGYLITGIILDDLQRGRFSIANFYERRMRRILPALFLVMFFCIAAFWFIMLPEQFSDFSQSLVATSVFASNVLFWQESGYFAAANEFKPLLHTWSLAVEEQFYLFFPLMCLLFWRHRSHTLVWITLAVMFASFALCEMAWRTYPRANFYLAPTRIWELFAGSICAHLMIVNRFKGNAVLSLMGLGMILASVFLLDSSVGYPSKYALLPVVGTVLVILFSAPDEMAGRLLSIRPLVWIGLVSYSAYLWHQPIFVFARMASLTWPTPEKMFVLSALTFLPAYVSWRFVEQPFRRADRSIFNTRPRVFAFSAVGILGFVVLGTVGVVGNGLPWRIDYGRVAALLAYQEFSYPERDTCYLVREEFPSDTQIADCAADADRPADAIFIGDSHADALNYTLGRALSAQGLNMAFTGTESCPPVIGFVRQAPYYDCDKKLRTLLVQVLSSPAQYVILHARWSYYLDVEPFANGVGGTDGENGALTPLTDMRRRTISDAYADFAEKLAEEGKTVVLIYPIPEAGWDVPMHLAKMVLRGMDDRPRLSIPYDAVLQRNASVIEVFDSIQQERIIRVRSGLVFCDPGANRCFQESESNIPLYRDPDHLTHEGAEMLAAEVVRQMFPPNEG
ncbi:acyltransferase family protein [Maritimibacter sp. 55A14]|uniref:acyltransferase family protein n=1 Tax=Maritimibacter sp. 55A14 TaxID=2174844 RepID=UPI001304B6C5|nr:acyltransferase family protein [Maritimibacter sp. 55A14]